MIEQGWTLYFICLNVLCIINNENDVEESTVFKNQNIFFFKIQNDKKTSVYETLSRKIWEEKVLNF